MPGKTKYCEICGSKMNRFLNPERWICPTPAKHYPNHPKHYPSRKRS